MMIASNIYHIYPFRVTPAINLRILITIVSSRPLCSADSMTSASHRCSGDSNPGHSMCWTKWRWGRFLRVLQFPLSSFNPSKRSTTISFHLISFRLSSITLLQRSATGLVTQQNFLSSVLVMEFIHSDLDQVG